MNYDSFIDHDAVAAKPEILSAEEFLATTAIPIVEPAPTGTTSLSARITLVRTIFWQYQGVTRIPSSVYRVITERKLLSTLHRNARKQVYVVTSSKKPSMDYLNLAETFRTKQPKKNIPITVFFNRL
ncbi:MAG: hypothetical protein HC905_31395 [Bacteroidales bacterium]|nr:hypothetical protein [Bacteroidales bacterium]